MAETANIAKMAEKLSNELFAEFFWRKVGSTNVNWPCEATDLHESKTHPSDVVFYYDEPYSQARTYVNCDLKSYAKGSITTSSIKSAIESLAKALSCAEKSEQFRENFFHEHVSPEICGLLFIYNHDGEYDKDFSSLLGQINAEELDIPPKSKIIVMGPADVFWLNNVRHEITSMRGAVSKLLPDHEHCKYFYPNLMRRKNVQFDNARAATLEMLTAPWIILTYTNPSKQNKKGYLIFYKKRGESVSEFLYLIDYLMHYQILLEENADVIIKILDPHPSAASHFDKAKSQYADENGGGQKVAERLNTIQFGQINDVRTKFSELELGMNNV